MNVLKKRNMVQNKSKYKNQLDWKKDNPKDYENATRRGMLDDICEYYGWERYMNKPRGYWNKERCIKEAKKYNTTSEWKKTSGSSYQSASTNGWVDECSKHIKHLIKPQGYWTKEKCIESAKEYKTRNSWINDGRGSYYSAKRNGWIEECSKHMVSRIKPAGYWNKKRCLEEAKKCKSKSQWKSNNGSSFNATYKSDWFDECIKHMK